MRPARAFYFLYYASLASLMPYLAICFASRGLSGLEIGMLTSILPLVTMLGAPFWTEVADATGRHRTVLISVIAVVLAAAFGLSLATHIVPLALLTALLAFHLAPAMPLLDHAVLEALGDRAHAYGRQRVWGAIGWAVSAPAAGWRWSCATAAGSPSSSPASPVAWGWRSPRTSSRSTCATSVPRSRSSASPPRRMLIVAVGTMALRLLLSGSIREPVALALVQVLHGPSFGVLWIAGVAYARELAPQGSRAVAQGLFVAVTGGLGGFAGSLLGGATFDALGGAGTFLVAAAFTALAAVLLAAWRRRRGFAEPAPARVPHGCSRRMATMSREEAQRTASRGRVRPEALLAVAMRRSWRNHSMPVNMRLAEFIRADMEPILQEWEDFASTLLPARHMGTTGLRDHARHMLLAIADDLDSYQSESERAAKSEGRAPKDSKVSSADRHGGERYSSGFTIIDAVSEFRALRASVVSLWTRAHPTSTEEQIEDLTRFHEAIDQAVAESLEQYAIEKELKTRLFGAVLLASPDPIYVLDLDGRFVYANKATSDLFALDLEAIIGRTCVDLDFPFAVDFQHNVARVIDEQSTYRGTFVHVFASGQGERFEYVVAPVLDEQRRTEATVCILRDTTEQALAEEKSWHAAHHDHLTGLPNRRQFVDRLEQQIKHAKRSGLLLYVLFLDLNGFKAVNDALGHEAGDLVLCEVAKRLVDCAREEDTVARHGGDEFTVIVAGAKHRDDVERVAQSIRDALEAPIPIAKRSFRISASIGVAAYPQDATSAADLLRAADRAMYVAKHAGSCT